MDRWRKYKVSPRARDLLLMIDQATSWSNDERPGTGEPTCWVPGDKTADVHVTDYEGRNERSIGNVSGAGDARALRALEEKRLIKRHPNVHEYAYSITEEGMVALAEDFESRDDGSVRA